jgi:hypothetical protein
VKDHNKNYKSLKKEIKEDIKEDGKIAHAHGSGESIL